MVAGATFTLKADGAFDVPVLPLSPLICRALAPLGQNSVYWPIQLWSTASNPGLLKTPPCRLGSSSVSPDLGRF